MVFAVSQSATYSNELLVLSFQHFVTLPYFLGKPIDQIVAECPKVTMAMKEVSQPSQVRTAYHNTTPANAETLTATRFVSCSLIP